MVNQLNDVPQALINAAATATIKAFEKVSIDPSSVPSMYHYTTIAGYSGIIQNGVLRGTHTAFMNDASEYRHGLEMASGIAKAQSEKSISEFKKSYFLKLSTELIELSILDHNPIFVSCFSKVRDDLNQWRVYAGDGGFMLTFDTKRVAQKLNSVRPEYIKENTPPPFLGRVIYCDQEKKELAESYLHDLISGIEFTCNAHNISQDVGVLAALKLTHVMGAYFIPLMKDSRFKAEDEIRILYWPKSIEEVQPLPKKSVLSGYVELPVSSVSGNVKTLPLSEVLVGPSPHQELNTLAATAFVRKNQAYNPVKIHRSSLPHRFF